MTKTSALLLPLLFGIATVQAEETRPNGSNDASDSEHVTIEDKRNQAFSEPTEETQKLLDIAGNAGDPLSAVYSLPGVVYAGGDAGGAPAIRGSSPDDNAYYIDGLPTGYIFHLFGDSIFNENLVGDFKLYPAAFDVHYGDATGGVIDVSLRDPRQQKLKTKVDVSLLKAGVVSEGKVSDDQAFYFSYRRSLVQFFIKEGDSFGDNVTVTKTPESDDYQGKFQWLLGDNQKLTFSMTGANDSGGINISAESVLGQINPDFIGNAALLEGFDGQSLQWEYFGPHHSIFRVDAGHLDITGETSYGSQQYLKSDLNQDNLRLAYEIEWFKEHRWSIGLDGRQSRKVYSFDFVPYYCTDHEQNCEGNKGDRQQGSATLSYNDMATYINDQWQISDNWIANIGLRVERNSFTQQQFNQPRGALTWHSTDNLSFTAKAGRYSRFPDTDKVLAGVGNPDLKSPEATHYSLATNYALDAYWHTSWEIYRKDLSELPLSLNEHNDPMHLHYVNELSGEARGVEWMLTKDLSNKWYGWFSLSWSRSERTDDTTGVTSDYYLDTPMIANLVLNYQWSERWDLGLRFTGRTGARYTPIVGIHPNPDYPDHYLPTYGELNSKQLPNYYRLDLQGEYKLRMFSNPASFTFGLLNSLGNANVEGYYFKPDGHETPEHYTIAKEVGLPRFPYVGFKFDF